MDERKKADRKFLISSITLAIGIFVLLGAFIGVYAATNQNLSSSFYIQYSVGENVGSRVKTEYVIGSTTYTATKDESGKDITDEEGYVVFNANENSKWHTVVIGDIELSPTTATMVEFYLTVDNISDVAFYVAGYCQLFTSINVEVISYVSSVIGLSTNYSASKWESQGLCTWNEYTYTGADATSYNQLAKDGKLGLKFILKVSNENKGATASGDLVLSMMNDYSKA